MKPRLQPWEIADRIVNWLVVPLAAISAVGNLLSGELLHAMFAVIWGVLVYSAQRQYRGWRDRTNAWAKVEMRDRAKFAADILMLKSHVAHTFLSRRVALLDDPDIRAAIVTLFDDVANTWIPDDAPQELHELKAGARKIAESDDPRPHLRIVH